MMKLKGIHLLFILIGVLILCSCLGGNIYEGHSSNGHPKKPVGGCEGTQYGCCPNSDTAKYDSAGSNCNQPNPQPQPSSTSTYNTAVITGGTSSSQIPAGDEDMYMLKSEIVPPVCPACPSVSSCPSQEPPPPCPPCARCPEPAFECKKVPNYSSNDDSSLPRPVLSDFSQFGM